MLMVQVTFSQVGIRAIKLYLVNVPCKARSFAAGKYRFEMDCLKISMSRIKRNIQMVQTRHLIIDVNQSPKFRISEKVQFRVRPWSSANIFLVIS